MAHNAIDGAVAPMIEACMAHPSRRDHLQTFFAGRRPRSVLKRRVVDVHVPIASALLDMVAVAARALGFKAENGVVRRFHRIRELELLVIG
jgi:hypothetical protein